jgi:uncharacterized protein with PQ loop repeat
MYCPKCKADNPDDAQVCGSCSHVLTSSETEKRKSRFKTSISAVSSFLFAGLSLLLAIFVRPTLAFIAALLGLLLLITSVVQTIRGKKKLTTKRIVLCVFIILEMISLTYWRIDAAPIPNDYTIFDLRSALPLWYGTYNLLNRLGDKSEDLLDAPAIGLSSEDLENLEEINNIFKEKDLQAISKQLQTHADDIISIWKNAEKGRDILSKLAVFPEIADLSEPDLRNYNFRWMKNFRRLIFLHRAYICLQSCQSNHEVAIDELIRLDTIFKKMSLNARSLVKKLICLACFRINIETANFIVNNPGTPNEIVLLLKQRMISFSGDHVSLRNPIIFEYLMFRNELRKITREPRFRYSYFSPLKLNSTLRLYRNFCTKWISLSEHRIPIEEFRIWPIFYPNMHVQMGFENKLPWYYKAYNPMGSLFVSILTPAAENILKIRTKLRVQSDMLQIVLNKRLGKEASLKARAYSDEYIVDIGNRKIFSPGPDGKADTNDDIIMWINPKVLGWRN